MELDHLITLPSRADLALTGVTDMAVVQSSGGSVLYTTSRFGGGDLLAYRIDDAGGCKTRINNGPQKRLRIAVVAE